MFFTSEVAPHVICNSLLEFFTAHMIASVSKVRPAKYSIRAEIFVEGISCGVKVKMFTVETESGNPGRDVRYALEFQKRSGCPKAFKSAYHAATTFVEARHSMPGGDVTDPAASNLQQSKEGPRLMEPHGASLTEESYESEHSDLAPTIDVMTPLATMALVSELQAEAAMGLSRLAQGGHASAVALFQVPEVTGLVLTKLLASEHIDAAYPAACCLSELANFREAIPVLTQPGLLLAAIQRSSLEARVARGLVSNALAQAVAAAVASCAEALSLSAANELQHSLQETLNALTPMTGIAAQGHLQQALIEVNKNLRPSL
jgi:hypothetical protein